MSLDHSDFIARHTPGHKDPKAAQLRARRILVSLVLISVYVVGCIALAVIFHIDRTTMIAAGFAFVLASILAFMFQRFLHNYSAQEKNACCSTRSSRAAAAPD